MADEKLEVVITADDRASSVFSGISGVLGGLGSVVLGGLALAATAAGTALFGLGSILNDSVSEAMESQNAMAQLEAVIKSTGGVAGVTADMASELANSLQKVTRFSDEAIMGGENLLLTFTAIGKDVFPDATEVMLDMSQALGQDLQSSAIQLGKALQDPILGVTALRRVGVNFTEADREMIKSMVEAGDVMGAQKFILQELQKEFGGSAEAAGKTFAGSLDILKNRFSDIKEELGMKVIPILMMLMDKVIMPLIPWIELAAEALGDFLTKFTSSPEFEAFITRVGEGLQKLIQLFIDLASGNISMPSFEVPPFLSAVSDWWTVNGPWIKEQADTLWTGFITSMQTAWTNVQPFINEVLTVLTDWFTENGPLIEKFVTQFVTAWNEKFVPAVLSAWERIGPILISLLKAVLDVVSFVMAISVKDWPAAWEAIKSVVVNVFWAIWDTIKLVLDLIAHLMGGSLDEIKTVWSSNWDQFQNIAWNTFMQVHDFIKEKLGQIREFLQTPLGTAIFEALQTVFLNIASSIFEVIDAVKEMQGVFSGLSIPDWLTPGSPTPLENGLVGIRNALTSVNDVPFPSFAHNSPLASNTPRTASGGPVGGTINLYLTYSPAISLGDEREVRDRLAPLMVQLLRDAQMNGVLE